MDKFKDLPYQRPDLAKVRKEYAALLKKFRNAATFEEADAAFLGFMKIAENVVTVNTIASIRNTMDMSDEFYDREIKFFNSEMPKLMLLLKKAVKALLGSPYRAQLQEKYGEKLFRDAEVQIKLLNWNVILPTIRESNLGTEYSKTVASCSVDFMGEKCNSCL